LQEYLRFFELEGPSSVKVEKEAVSNDIKKKDDIDIDDLVRNLERSLCIAKALQ
jgi:hypothetical protein